MYTNSLSVDKYEHPLINRYSSKEMNYIWSPKYKFSTWRTLWYILAESQQELGLNINDNQLTEMKENIHNIDFNMAADFEKKYKHDVMAHVHTYGNVAPLAKPIIHLGATSCYVGDNTDLIQMRESLCLIRNKLIKLIDVMSSFAMKYKDLPTLGFTHFQPAQLTTVGKRSCIWLHDILIDFNEINLMIKLIPARGIKGTTGTEATYLELFDGDHGKVKKLNELICNKIGFDNIIPISGQTYTRKYDYKIICILSGLAQSAHKMCSDIRLLSSLKEIEEPFEKSQIGSSAMAYKRNPMRCERVCSISKYLMSFTNTMSSVHANQWFERTLDDSACRRMVIPESFLSCDVIVNTLINIMDGIIVWPKVIESNIKRELPFMATEKILMQCVKNGGDRQELHEAIREHSINAGIQVKQYGEDNDLLKRIASDKRFNSIHSELNNIMNPLLFIGRASEQVDDFLNEYISIILENNKDVINNVKINNINV